MNTPTDGHESSHLSSEENPRSPNPATDAGDQDIDTAATNAYDEFASHRGDDGPKSSAPAAFGDAVDNDGKPIGLHDPSSMSRAEDDAEVLERSPEFHDRPGSGKYR